VKPIVCLYCEGNDTKVAVISKEQDKLKVAKVASYDFVHPAIDIEDGFSSLNMDSDGLTLEKVEKETSVSSALTVTGAGLISAALRDFNLSKYLFIPALTEPSIYYHIFEGKKNVKNVKLTQEILNDIKDSKNIFIEKDNLGYMELSDRSMLSVFLSGDVPCVNLVNSIARHNGRRYYKIPTIKSAEVSLAYYVAKKKKFFPDDSSLIVYIGKEYSKLIFLQGRKLKHIGGTLDIGTVNLHTYDVYFSKILLEMENGGISQLDNIVVCGEDDSENLILSFYGTFPEANVSRMEFEEFDTAALDEDSREKISSFTVPFAVATEYFDELAGECKGINLLPKYVRDEQKPFQFAWHGYAVLPLLFGAALMITLQVMSGQKTISALDREVKEKTLLAEQNQQILNDIKSLEAKVNTFDQTQAILDTVSAGASVWSGVLADISDFFAARKNIWLTKVASDDNNSVLLEGYALDKRVLTDFAYSIESAELKSMVFEELRERNAYKFNLVFNLLSFPKK
jgi:Tfp pilus assembly protein PilN